MHILFVMPKFAPGGAEKSLLMLLHALSDEPDLKIDLLLFKKEGLFLKQVPAQVNIIDQEESLKLCYSKFSSRNLRSLRGAWIGIVRPVATALSGLFAKNPNHKTQLRWKYAYKRLLNPCPDEYDIACGYLDGEAVYYVVDKVMAKKKIGWNQNDYNGLGYVPQLDEPYYGQLDAIVTLTTECNEILKKVFPQYADKMQQIPPIVTQDYIERCALEYEPPEYAQYTGCKLISVGRLVEQKGFDIAIDACRIMKDAGLDFRWFIIGNGVLMEALTKQIQENDLANTVFLLGENGNPYPYIKRADLFVQPSRFEGKSVILNEAKMLCRPILATHYPTVADQIKNMENGVIVDLDADALARGIMDTLRDEPLKAHLVDTLRRTDFNDSQTKANYRKLFGIIKE